MLYYKQGTEVTDPIRNLTKTLHMKTLKTIATVAIIILAIDFVGFLGWAMSGQRPVDNFYVGTITTHALRAVIN